MFVVAALLFFVITLIVIVAIVWYKTKKLSKNHEITTIKFHDEINTNRLVINDLILEDEEQDNENVISSESIRQNTESINTMKGYVDDKIKELKDELKKVPETKYYQKELFSTDTKN